MKREIWAAMLLAALFAFSLWNIAAIGKLTACTQQHITLSEQAACAGDSAGAEAELAYALSIWLSADSYTRIFIRHPELDSTADAFYQVMEGLKAGDGRELSAEYDMLRYHLDSIADMERLSLGSIL